VRNCSGSSSPRASPELRVLSLIVCPDLGQHLASDLLEVKVHDLVRVPAIRVPSIDTTPDCTNAAL
jgi:hypothetical protein